MIGYIALVYCKLIADNLLEVHPLFKNRKKLTMQRCIEILNSELNMGSGYRV